MKTIAIVLALMSPISDRDAIEQGSQCRIRCDWQCYSVPQDEWEACHSRCLRKCRKPKTWDYEQ